MKRNPQSFTQKTTATDVNYLLNFLQVPHLHTNKKKHEARLAAIGLPKSHGGGGFRFSKNTQHSAYLGSWVSTYRSCADNKTKLLPLFETFWSLDSLTRLASLYFQMVLTMLLERITNFPTSPSKTGKQAANLCLDVRIVSTHTTKPFKRLYQLPDGSDTVHPARDILAPAHSARISKFKEYATPFNAARLNPGRNQSTPEERRTLQLTTLSDSLVTFSFFL